MTTHPVTYWDRKTHDQYQLMYTEALTTGEAREVYCKIGGITGETMTIKYQSKR